MIATAGYDHEIKLWDPASSQSLHAIRSEGHINRLAFSPDNKFLAAAGHGQVRLYDHHSPNPQAQGAVSFSEHKLNVTAIGFHRDAKWLFSASEDCTVRLWDMRDKKSQRQHQAGGAVNAAVLHPNQTEILIGTQTGQLTVWDCSVNKSVRQYTRSDSVVSPSPLRAVVITPDGTQCFAADNDGNVMWWNYGQEAQVGQINAHGSYVLQLSVSRDSKLLATFSADRLVRVWKIETMELIAELVGHNRWVWDGLFTMDGKSLVSVSSDLSMRLWDIAAGEARVTYIGHNKAVVCVAMNEQIAQ